MKEAFIDWQPRGDSLAMVERAIAIADEYAAQGLVLTLRQLFYQFVARDLLENTRNAYRQLGRLVGHARDAGLMDWDAIEDRTRTVHEHSTWRHPQHILQAVARQYRVDPWESQEYRVEVWIEKDALLGVIEGICTEYKVPYFAHRGNNSQTLQYEAGKRFANYVRRGLTPLVLHLADHDPNGIDMTRDNERRLELYAGEEIEVRRIALNMDQIRRYNPPPNFVKETDSRTGGYRDQFGTDECWELDALDPTVIVALIEDELDDLIEAPDWERQLMHEQRERAQLTAVAAKWPQVEKLVRPRR
jgi:hypothetical protein